MEMCAKGRVEGNTDNENARYDNRKYKYANKNAFLYSID